MKNIFTSESVAQGHPDKICDAISDAVLDAILAKDLAARVACETTATTGMVFVAGEITADCYVDIEGIVRQTVREIGYNGSEYGFDSDSCAVIVSLKGQSPDIAQGVDHAMDATDSTGAGDQGMMFGYATDETSAYMPLPIYLSHQLVRNLDEARKSGLIPYLRPDGKSQVSVEYVDGKPTRIDAVVVSAQHDPDVEHATIEADIIEKIVRPAVNAVNSGLIDTGTKFYINPTGRFVIGGPKGDVGLTGRKIIVDTYGGMARHGGGAFSGKDPTKVDRSGAYMARYVAKNIVAAGLAKVCELQIAYAIGVAKPVSVYINTFGTGAISDSDILRLVDKHFDLSPAAIIKHLDLLRPIYKQTAAYGHFGRTDVDLPWERLDMVDVLKKEF